MTPFRTLTLVSSAGCGLAIGLLVLAAWNPPWVPPDGTVGPAVAFGFNPYRRYAGYFLLTVAPCFFSWLAIRFFPLFRRSESQSHPAGVAPGRIQTIAWLSGAAVLLLAAWRSDKSLFAGLARLFSSGDATAEVCVLVALVAAIFLPNFKRRRGAVPTPDDPEVTERRRYFGAFLLLAFHLFVLIQPCFGKAPSAPTIAVGAAAVLSFAMFFRRASASPAAAESRESTWPWIPLTIWPCCVPLMRNLMTGADPSPGWWPYRIGAVCVIIVPLVAICLPAARVRRPAPVLLLPASIFALIHGGLGVDAGYDAFHQGEYTYPWLAWMDGLTPFRDIFIVHGPGANMLGGLLAGDRIRSFPNLDAWSLDITRSAGVAVMFLFYYRLTGSKAWPVALLLALVTAQADPTKGGRHLGTQIALLLALHRLSSGRRAHMVAAGAASAGWFLYSFDSGFTAVAGFGFWLIMRATVNRRHFTDLAAYCAGAILIVGLTLVAHLATGSGDVALAMLQQLREFGGTKLHYDCVPWDQPAAVYFLAPAVTVLAALRMSVSHTRSGVTTDAASGNPAGGGIISLLMILNALTWLRALDRPDEGHMIYAMVFAWPLLAAVAFGGDGGAGRRTGALMAFILLLPFASDTVRGERGPTTWPLSYITWYMENSSRPAALPRADLDGATEFFALCDALDAAVPGNAFMLDMTNQPAVYVHSRVRSPTRYYATFQHSPELWQRRIIGDLERTRTEFILVPGADHPARRIDGIETDVRHPALHEFLARHFEPRAELTPGNVLYVRRAEEPPATR